MQMPDWINNLLWMLLGVCGGVIATIIITSDAVRGAQT